MLFKNQDFVFLFMSIAVSLNVPGTRQTSCSSFGTLMYNILSAAIFCGTIDTVHSTAFPRIFDLVNLSYSGKSLLSLSSLMYLAISYFYTMLYYNML